MRSMVAALCSFVLLTGCDGGRTIYPSAKLEGAVSVAGEPVTDGLIMFMPQQQGRGSGVKAAIKDGCYSADNVPLGNVLVTFNAMQETGRMVESPSSPGKLMPERIDLIPEKYRSGMAVEVKAGDNKRDFEL